MSLFGASSLSKGSVDPLLRNLFGLSTPMTGFSFSLSYSALGPNRPFTKLASIASGAYAVLSTNNVVSIAKISFTLVGERITRMLFRKFRISE